MVSESGFGTVQLLGALSKDNFRFAQTLWGPKQNNSEADRGDEGVRAKTRESAKQI